LQLVEMGPPARPRYCGRICVERGDLALGPEGGRLRLRFGRHPTGAAQKDINDAIDGYADDMLSDLVYSVERDLEHESEALIGRDGHAVGDGRRAD
jgi:hypothetical protein